MCPYELSLPWTHHTMLTAKGEEKIHSPSSVDEEKADF